MGGVRPDHSVERGQPPRRHEPGPARVSPWLAAPLFGLSALMALIGLQLGRAAAGFIRIRSDLLTGVALVVMATVMGPHACVRA